MAPKRLLIPNGPEVFLSPESAEGRSLLIVEGVYAHEVGSWLRRWSFADAAFACDEFGRFVVPHPGVRCGREESALRAVHEDRELHRYVYLLTVGCEKVSLTLHPPTPSRLRPTRGYLLVTTCPASDALLDRYVPRPAAEERVPCGPGPHELLLIAERTAQIRREEASATERTAERQRELDERRRGAWIASQVREYEDSPHYTDETYLRNLAATETRQLLAYRGDFNREWEEFHADPEAIRRLKLKHPEIYERARYKRRATAFAEQIAVAPKALPPRPERSSPKETPKEYQQRQSAHRRRLVSAELTRAREEKRAIAALGKLDLTPEQYDARLAQIHEVFATPDPKEEAHNAKKI